MKWNGKTIGGGLLVLTGIWSVLFWGGLKGLLGYAVAFALLFIGLRLWLGANDTLKKVCSGLVLAAGAALLLFWLPNLIVALFGAILIVVGLQLIRVGQTGGTFTYRYFK